MVVVAARTASASAVVRNAVAAAMRNGAAAGAAGMNAVMVGMVNEGAGVWVKEGAAAVEK